EHGHIVLTIPGLDLTGRQEIERLEAAGFRLMHQTKSCLCSIRRKGSYYKNHRLVTGQRYKIALMPTREIERDSDRTTVALREHGMKYGYKKPLAGIVPRIREMLSNKQIDEMCFGSIAAPNDTIEDLKGNPKLYRKS